MHLARTIRPSARRLGWALPLLLTIAIASCQTIMGDGGRVILDAEVDEVEIRRWDGRAEATIPVTIVNASARTVYVVTCSGPADPIVVVERLEEGRWTPRHSAMCMAGIQTLHPLRAGETLRAQGGVGVAAEEGQVPVLAGTYRARVTIWRSTQRRLLLPEAQRTSAPFEIRD